MDSDSSSHESYLSINRSSNQYNVNENKLCEEYIINRYNVQGFVLEVIKDALNSIGETSLSLLTKDSSIKNVYVIDIKRDCVDKYNTEQIMDLLNEHNFKRAYYYYIIPIENNGVTPTVEDKNIIFPDNNVRPIRSCMEFEDILCVGDYSNKILTLSNKEIQVVKTKLAFDNTKRVLFVLNRSAVEEIKTNQYHLDDLQHDIANALGIQSDELELFYIPKNVRNMYKNFQKVKLTKILEPIDPICVSKKPIKHIEVILNDEINATVEIQNETHGAHWLGGYKNNKTGIYYHNAKTQTDPKKLNYGQPSTYKPPNLKTIETQTKPPQKSVGINLPVDSSTQMWRSDYYISSNTDIILEPRPYIPFEYQFGEIKRKSAASSIQRFWKVYKTRKQSQNYSKMFANLKNTIIQLNKPGNDQSINTHYINLQILNMTFPNRNIDFVQFHAMLSEFEKSCTRNGESSIVPGRKKSIAYQCQQKGVEILNEIRKKKQSITFPESHRKMWSAFESSTMPTIKHNCNNDCIYLIENYDVDRNKGFKELYALFKRKDVSIQQRIEILMLFKQLLNSLSYFNMKDDLFQLIDRECIMLCNGINPDDLEIFRKREEEIILHFFKCVKCHANKPVLKEIIRCKYCRKFKNISAFPVQTKQSKITACMDCTFEYKFAHSSMNYSFYIDLLNQIRQNEFKLGCRNPYVTLLHPDNLEHIVQKIWGARSALSYKKKLTSLRLPRWHNHEPWTPWNCILLTNEEAILHENVDNVNTFYGETFRNLISQKHLLALQQYRSLLDTENLFRNKWVALDENEFRIGKKTLINSFSLAGDSFFNSLPKKFIP